MDADLYESVSRQTLVRLLETPCEGANLDFKQTYDLGTTRDRVHLAKHVLAMANSGGGHLVIGIADGSRALTGIDSRMAATMLDSKTVNDRIKPYCGPFVAVNVAHHDLPNDKGEMKHVILVHIPAAESTIPAQGDGTYTEIGDTRKQFTAFYRGQVLIRRADQTVAAETPSDLIRKPRKNGRSSANLPFLNPYDISHTASKHMFKGREEEIERLLDAIETATHCAIFGLQRIGKTSLVEETLTSKISERGDLKKSGSEQEFDGSPTLCCLSDLLKFDEFSIGHGHALGLQQ